MKVYVKAEKKSRAWQPYIYLAHILDKTGSRLLQSESQTELEEMVNNYLDTLPEDIDVVFTLDRGTKIERKVSATV